MWRIPQFIQPFGFLVRNTLRFLKESSDAVLMTVDAENNAIIFGNETELKRENGDPISSGDGGASLTVQIKTGTSGAPSSVTANGEFITNEGATEEAYNALPTAAANKTATFYCKDGDGIRIVANSGDTIRLLDSVTPAAGYIRTTQVGAVVTLVAINGTEWVNKELLGIWEVSS